MSPSERELPDIASILGQLVGRVSPEQRPLLIALAERLAADRYRAWAREVHDPARESQLLACADREDDIGARVQGLYQNAADIQHEIRAANPDLEQINRALFTGRSLEQQFALQAQGERLGATTWRSFAGLAKDAKARATFLCCAELEEDSARCLEALLRGEG